MPFSISKFVISLLVLSLPILAQDPAAEAKPDPKPDQITLNNGDVLRGKILTLLKGKLKFESPALGELEIPLENITDIETAESVTIENKAGEMLQRRITGLADGKVALGPAPAGGPEVGDLAQEDLVAINPPPKPPAVWSGALSIGAYSFSGNTKRRGANATLDLKRKTDADRISAGVNWDYAQDKDSGDWELTQRRLAGRLQYDYFLSERSYLLATTAAEGDRFKDIDLRYTAGAGYGYQLFDSEEFKLSVEAGVNYFHEDYRSDISSEGYVAARAATDMEWVMHEKIKFVNRIVWLPSLEDADDQYVRVVSGLRASLTEAMFAEAVWEFDYDNTPSPGFNRRDNR
ncbi:MAG: DUF481 domain-containing protein, partial [Planctomycetota bacterium]